MHNILNSYYSAKIDCEILIKYLKVRASLSFLRYKPELIVLPHHCCGTGIFVNHVLSKQFDVCVSLMNCWIKFMATEKGNDKVCDTHNESLYYTHKKYYFIWSRLFFKNECATISSSYLSGVGNFCTLSG